MKTSIPGLVIRETRLNDLNPIYRLGINEPGFASMDGWNPANLADTFCRNDLIAYTAARKKEVLGFIIGRITGNKAEIMWIMVIEKLRKRRIGSALLDSFINKTENRGAKEFSVSLFPDNTETEAFFYKRDVVQTVRFIRLSGKIKTGECS